MTTLVFLIGISSAAAVCGRTLRFETFDLRLDRLGCGLESDGCTWVNTGSDFALPVYTFFVRVESRDEISTISYTADRDSVLQTVAPGGWNRDIPTSLEHSSDSIDRKNELGDRPVVVDGIVERDGELWARLIVLPVTVELNGMCVLHKSVGISIRGRSVESTEVVSSSDFITGDEEKNSRASAQNSGGAQYLIVTGPELVAAFERLAAYKTATGIPAMVVEIGTVLGSQTGRDEAEKLREYLKAFYLSGGEYVLLAGDEQVLPVRYAYHSTAYTVPDLAEQQICDLYFADLTGEWDADGDGVWGERYADSPDLTPEIRVGRLPFSSIAEAESYVNKLIAYETNPGGGDGSYLSRAFFFSSDQMRDYNVSGQHYFIAHSYPSSIAIDTISGVELSSGMDPSPYNLSSFEAMDILNTGYGFVNIVSHGSNSSFAVRTAYYNEWPKSSITTDTTIGSHAPITSLAPNGMTSVYYSLACDNAAFDADQPPFNASSPNLAQTLLGLADAGAVAFVGNTRWGWVGSSYLFQSAFFDSLFAHPGRPIVDALYDAKAAYYYYRDEVYSLNYFGDPTLKAHTELPQRLTISLEQVAEGVNVVLRSGGDPVAGGDVFLSSGDTLLAHVSTGIDGRAHFTADWNYGQAYLVAAVVEGYSIGLSEFIPSLGTDIDSDDAGIPGEFVLRQNYPNPFNPSTVISFDVPARSRIRLSVYNITGRLVSVLVNDYLEAGSHSAEWNGRDFQGNAAATGVYVYRLEADGYAASGKMILLK